MNRRLATGMRNAQDPIIIGNAAIGFMPSRLTMIMHGAYNPMPIVISAPKQKLTAIPIHKRVPSRPSAFPVSPKWLPFRFVMINNAAAASRALPIPICT